MTTSPFCPACRSDKTLERTFGEVTEYKGADVTVEGLHGFHCDNCGYNFETHAQHDENVDILRAAYLDQREAQKRKIGRLTGQQIRGIRVALGLSQVEAADLFGGSVNTFSRYETEEVVQPAAMDRLMRLAAHIGQASVDLIRESAKTFYVRAATPDASAWVWEKSPRGGLVGISVAQAQFPVGTIASATYTLHVAGTDGSRLSDLSSGSDAAVLGEFQLAQVANAYFELESYRGVHG